MELKIEFNAFECSDTVWVTGRASCV